MNSLRFCLSGNIFISSLFLKDSFARYKTLDLQFLSALWIFILLFLVSIFSEEKSAVNLIGD